MWFTVIKGGNSHFVQSWLGYPLPTLFIGFVFRYSFLVPVRVINWVTYSCLILSLRSSIPCSSSWGWDYRFFVLLVLGVIGSGWFLVLIIDLALNSKINGSDHLSYLSLFSFLAIFLVPLVLKNIRFLFLFTECAILGWVIVSHSNSWDYPCPFCWSVRVIRSLFLFIETSVWIMVLCSSLFKLLFLVLIFHFSVSFRPTNALVLPAVDLSYLFLVLVHRVTESRYHSLFEFFALSDLIFRSSNFKTRPSLNRGFAPTERFSGRWSLRT